MPPSRKLKVFLCHASEDKPKVRELYKKLAAETWIQPWLDEEDLLPGQDFDLAIYKAARDADIIIICLSTISVEKTGYLNKEIRRALDVADEKPEDTIYMIPLRLDDCQPSFERLKKLHWVDYFTPNAHDKLIRSLRLRAEVLQIQTSNQNINTPSNSEAFDKDLDLYKFIEIPKDKEVPYTFYIGKYPVTNAQYERFLNAPDFAKPVYWIEIPKFDENCQRIGDWGEEGLKWLREELKKTKLKILYPRYWKDENFGITNPNNPVVGISWYEANAYCEWLFQNWNILSESKTNVFMKPQSIRLPLETEWQKAAGGIIPEGRYAWDEKGKETISIKEILRRANIRYREKDKNSLDDLVLYFDRKNSEIGKTTNVTAFPENRSPYGVMDMSGNVFELQANFLTNELTKKKENILSIHGGSWMFDKGFARIIHRNAFIPHLGDNNIGFRVVFALQ